MPTLQNPRHELFARGVVEGKSADASYTDAGYKPGRNNAARLRANEVVQTRIKELQGRGLRRHDITVDRIIEEYCKLAFSDIRRLFDAEGRMLMPHELPDDVAGALTSLEVTINPDGKGGKIAKIRLADKRASLADLGKHFNIFEADNTVKAEVPHKEVSDLEFARRFAFVIARAVHKAKAAKDGKAAGDSATGATMATARLLGPDKGEGVVEAPSRKTP